MKYEATTSRTKKVTILAVMIGLIALVYTFGASPYANDGTFGTLQAQESNGAITGLTLTSDAPGTLTVSWDNASPTPTDYRVDWAKSDEGYKSWKVDEGHNYPAPSATTATITDLDHDTEYKIRMRARYYKGEHMGSSWGGPWAEATITVAGEPADTPTPEPSPDPTPDPGTIDTLAATDDDASQLVLTWEAPAAPNADPTDYHVNWAKSVEDYPADTAEAGNAHPTTTTHTLTGLEYDIRLQHQSKGTLHRRRERRQPVERTVDGNHRPGQAAAAHGHQHDGRRRQSGKSSLSVLVGPLE